jgi:hypothetical protein
MELKSILHTILSSDPDEDAIRELIFICRKIALVHLRKKGYRGELCRDFSPLRLDDLALDCIADLFNRDAAGTFPQIKSYFEGLSLEKSSEEELLTHLRRLVFARTNQNVFRIYHEADPGLSKILRNIKLAIQSLQSFICIERFGEQCVTPSMCDTLEQLPPFEPDELEQYLRQRITNNDSVPSMLAKFSLFLREQTDHSRIISLMTIAKIFRSMYETPFLGGGQQAYTPEFVTLEDVRTIITSVCASVKNENVSHYVGRKKVDPQIFESYFDVILEDLFQEFLDNDGGGFSFFDRLQRRLPCLTKDEYKDAHKSKLEYLARLAYERTMAELKKNL